MGRACLLIVSIIGLEERKKKGKAEEQEDNWMDRDALEFTG